MPDPYRAKQPRTVVFPEGRLRRLGANDATIEEMLTQFRASSPQEQRDSVLLLAGFSDDELRASIEWMDDASSTDDEPEPVPDGTVSEVLNWVGEDIDRAKRALEVEKAGRQRTSLLYELGKRG